MYLLNHSSKVTVDKIYVPFDKYTATYKVYITFLVHTFTAQIDTICTQLSQETYGNSRIYMVLQRKGSKAQCPHPPIIK